MVFFDLCTLFEVYSKRVKMSQARLLFWPNDFGNTIVHDHCPDLSHNRVWTNQTPLNLSEESIVVQSVICMV